MNIKKAYLFLLLLPAVAFVNQGCNKCSQSGIVTLSPTNQFLAITYKTPGGVNYLTGGLINQSNAGISVSTNNFHSGGTISISDDFTDGKFGPITYTSLPRPEFDVVSLGLPYEYSFVIARDTFPTDTFRVKFYPTADECREYWSYIEYYRNGVLIANCDGQEICDIEITE